MEEYFLLKQKASNPIEIQGMAEEMYQIMPVDKKFEQMRKLSVGYMAYNENKEVPEILLNPILLVSNGLKKLITIYDESIEWKGVQIYPQEEHLINEISPLYWCGNFPEQMCLHEDAQLYSDLTVKDLILDRRKIRNLSIFRIGGIRDNRIVISLDLAESILRRRFYGVGIETLSIK